MSLYFLLTGNVLIPNAVFRHQMFFQHTCIVQNVACDSKARPVNLFKLTMYTGARLIYLPPYSPDLNPIEETFSFLKVWLRRHVREAINPQDSRVTNNRYVWRKISKGCRITIAAKDLIYWYTIQTTCLCKALWSFLCKLLQLYRLSFQESRKSNCPNNRHIWDNVRGYSRLLKCSLTAGDVDPLQPQKVNEESLNLLGGRVVVEAARQWESMHDACGRRNRRNESWVPCLSSEECFHELYRLICRCRGSWCWRWCRTSTSAWPR